MLENCSKVICMLPNTNASRSVFESILKYAKKGTTILEGTTLEHTVA